jgi:N-acetylglucosamine-6-sulfatase
LIDLAVRPQVEQRCELGFQARLFGIVLSREAESDSLSLSIRRSCVKLISRRASRIGLVSVGAFAGVAAAQDTRPNIVYIFADDHAEQSISAYGHPISKLLPTPNLDRIASEGAIFTNSFCTNSICAPSRATVLTGLFSHLNGKKDHISPVPFDGSQTTFPKLLHAAGYQTALVGKWHLESDPTGFDKWEILLGQGQYYNPDFKTADGTHREIGYSADIITQKSIDWMKARDTSRPFMMLVWHKSPHRNWMPAPRNLPLLKGVTIPEPETLFDNYEGRTKAAAEQEMEIDRHMNFDIDLKVTPPLMSNPKDVSPFYNRMNEEQRRTWDDAYAEENRDFERRRDSGELTGKELVRWKYQRYMRDYLRTAISIDQSVGELLRYLEESGLDKNTIVVYSSDQGFYLGEHGWFDKRWMYEESLRMPLMIRWPGRINPGTKVERMVQNIDHAPTLLEAAGVKVPETMQGASMLPLLTEGSAAPHRDAIYYHYYEYGEHKVPSHYGVRTEQYKLIFFDERNEWELYDLRADPHELKSVYEDPAYASIRNELKTTLRELRTKYRDDTGKAFE